jgi:hypothetical protein
MPRAARYQLPTPGQRYEDLDGLEPGARPTRPAERPPAEGGRRRRKQAVARRSRERLNPTGGYFYWCEHCNYCNTVTEGQKARCPDHAASHEANRKATTSTPTGLSPQVLAEVHRRARATATARQQVLIAERNPRDLATARAALDRAISALLGAINNLPRPPAP